MIIRQQSLEQMPEYPFEQTYPLDKIAFFDIETTGFAAEATYLYLIGCAYYKEDSFHLIQWFSEDIREEALLISSFFDFFKSYEILIHYNGLGFDIPYLQRKAAQLKLDCSFASIKSLDIYKKLYPYRKLFRLDSFKLKSIEAFLHIHREDTLGGGELIPVYQSYLGKKRYETLKKTRNPEEIRHSPSEADLLLNKLLLHNADDIRGLLSVSSLLYYADLFEKPIHIIQAGVEKGMLRIRFETLATLPVPINYENDLVHLTAFDELATLSVPVYEGELKYFYDNYRDYYYLPAEDCAVHKSVASFVEKAYREKAKASNCYTRKPGVFAPQYEALISPYFKSSYQDKITFLELHTDFLLQEENLELYVTHLLSHLISTS